MNTLFGYNCHKFEYNAHNTRLLKTLIKSCYFRNGVAIIMEDSNYILSSDLFCGYEVYNCDKKSMVQLWSNQWDKYHHQGWGGSIGLDVDACTITCKLTIQLLRIGLRPHFCDWDVGINVERVHTTLTTFYHMDYYLTMQILWVMFKYFIMTILYNNTNLTLKIHKTLSTCCNDWHSLNPSLIRIRFSMTNHCVSNLRKKIY